VRRSAAPVLAALAALALGSCAPAGPPAPPRGILVLLVDCLRADHIAAGGSQLGATPSIDSLAPEAVAFDRAFVQASWTRPSVPSLLTGLYPSEHGLTDFVATGSGVAGNTLAPEVVTIAEGMKAAGYRTALVGYQAQLSPRFALDQGFDFFNNNTNGAGRIHQRFLGWLDEEPDRPFFGYLHYLDIHWPYCPPEGTYGKYDPTPGTIALCENWRALREQIRAGEIEFSAADKRALAARYAEELLALDGQIGALFEELKKRGLWDDTLIVVTSDHGEEFFEHGRFGHNRTLFEEVVHIPLILRYPPGLPGETRVDELASLADVAPTILDLCRLPAPAAMWGRSLLDAARGRALEPRDAPLDLRLFREDSPLRAVRGPTHKFVRAGDAPLVEVYELDSDPGERHPAPAADDDPRLGRAQALWDDLERRARVLQAGEATGEMPAELEQRLRGLGYIEAGRKD
jgi:choline-sulfatase